jgi:copper transport protein
VLDFSEPVQAEGARITVIAPSGRILPGGRTRVQGAQMIAPFTGSERGTYLVLWSVVAEDTHPSEGRFTFSVGFKGPVPLVRGGGAGPAGLLDALGRWLHFVGMALGFGTVAYRVFALPEATPEQQRRLDRLTMAGVALMLVAEPGTLAGASLGSDADPHDLLVSSFGLALALRLGGALLLWSSMGAVHSARGRGRLPVLGLGAAVTLADQLSVHRIAGLPAPATFLAGGLHEAAMILWVGGIAAWLAVRDGAFGRTATLAVGVLAVTGVALAFGHLSGVEDLLRTPYGLVLVLKSAAAVGAVALAGLGRRRPEAVAVAGVLGLAALLVGLPPPR